MRLQPRWWVGSLILLLYAAWVFAAWLYFDMDYRDMGSEANLARGVVIPLGIAALGMAAFNTIAQWWGPTLSERRESHPVYMAVLMIVMLGFIAVNVFASSFSMMTSRHFGVLVVAVLLVGFCEEMATRGILLVSLRGSLRSETSVWFWSSALFGLLHATNAFFGVGAAALLQVVLAFCVGTGLYLLRRFSGTLVLPMLVHAGWDFSTLSTKITHAPMSYAALGLMASTYVASLVLVFLVLRRDDRRAVSL